MAGKSTDGKVRCSFCNKTQDQVQKTDRRTRRCIYL